MKTADQQKAIASRAMVTLVGILKDANRAYFNGDNPLMTDAQYDDHYRKLQSLEQAHPDLVRSDSPTQRVGAAPPDTGSRVNHQVPMLSLDVVWSEDELRCWHQNLMFMLSNPDLMPMIGQPKLDGVAVALRYEHGHLVSAATRGDGKVGRDITAHACLMQSIPLRLHTCSAPEWVEVHGEAVISKTAWERESNYKYGHPRTAVAATLRGKDTDNVVNRGLEFVTYDHHRCFESEWTDAVKSWGFTFIESRGLPDLDAAIDFVNKSRSIRAESQYPTDGLVIKLDHYYQRQFVGNSSRAPRWAVACKT